MSDPNKTLFPNSEVERLLAELDDLDTPHTRRFAIGERLAELGDPRPGVGLRPDGVPEILWCAVLGGEYELALRPYYSYPVQHHNFTIKPFFIARYPVTHIQFQTFLGVPNGYANDVWWAGMPPKWAKKQPIVAQLRPFANYPRDSVSWYQAVAFGRWLDHTYAHHGLKPDPTMQIRLPTEWEWQWAASGGNPANEYPWGAWDSRRANTTETKVWRTSAVGVYPHGAAVCGALDMSGNVAEWCLNNYRSLKVIELDDDELKTLRGGEFDYNHYGVSCTSRMANDPLIRRSSYGFRLVCASPISNL